MSSFHLFWRRMLRDWHYQFKVFRSIADWTIWLYLIIPAIAIFFFMYRSWWVEAVPGWIEWVPLSMFFVLGSLFAWSGAYRMYTDEADKVFLMKNSRLFLGMKKWGFWYSVLYQALLSILAVGLLLPFMIQHYKLSWLHALSLFLYLLGTKYFLMYVNLQLKKIEFKTIRILVTIVLFVLVCIGTYHISGFWTEGNIVFIIFSLLIGMLGITLYHPLLKKNSLFELELASEREEKLKLVNAIYQVSYDIEKPKVFSRKKPWLFRNSYQLFNKRTSRNGFIELYLKVFIRNSSYILTYFQISSVTSVALIVVPPYWIKAIIFGGFLFMMWIWLEGSWERIVLSHPLTKKYHDHDSYFSAKRRMLTVLYVLSIIFIGAIVGVGLWIYRVFAILT
ncbi:ABC transporter permease [Robertmurraya andreesenii]|uniref:ABC-2 type transport system permease protein n=1 Tax=Anoxybacillus andreesenii TaxID=1325932 RepID=A0ABT9V6K7_9BACL|nr:ABC transporter permease [Robertmurraya andreesenii]MDQ0156590.1 ABC-2 type transport system permease protein [Robertmurraya andreesenii]